MEHVQRELMSRCEEAAAKMRELRAKGGAGAGRLLERLLRYRLTYAQYQLARMFGIQRRVRVRSFFGGRFFVPANDAEAFSMGATGMLFGDEYRLVKFLIRTLRPHDVFYDVGANMGFYSALLERIVKDGQVHAFEPSAVAFACLRRNAPRCRANNVAVSDANGTAMFFDASRIGWSGRGSLVPSMRVDGSVGVSVRVTTLDAYASSHRPPNILKIDVEGAEFRVLAGARRTLEKHHPVIVMELWGGAGLDEDRKHALAFLQSLGYRAHLIEEDGSLLPTSFDALRDGKFTVENIVYV